MREALRDGADTPWFAVGTDPTALATIERLAEPLACAVRRVTGLDELGRDGAFRAAANPFVILADPNGDPALQDALLVFLDGPSPGGTYLYVTDELGGERYKRLLRSGKADWVTWAALPTDLPALARSRSRSFDPPRHSRLWGILPSKGGSGVTTLAAEIAFELSERRSRRGARVAVADLNLGGGTLADALDVEPRLDFMGILDRPDRLDIQLVDAFTSRFSPRLDVFASARRWTVPRDLEPTILFSLLDLLATRYHDLLVDIPNGWQAWRDDLLRGLDGVVVCGDDTVPGVRTMRAAVSHLAELGLAPDRIVLAINRCELDVFGRPVRRSELERALPAYRLVWIRNDAASVSHAQNNGQTIAQTAASSRVGKDMRAIVDWIETVTVPAVAGVSSSAGVAHA